MDGERATRRSIPSQRSGQPIAARDSRRSCLSRPRRSMTAPISRRTLESGVPGSSTAFTKMSRSSKALALEGRFEPFSQGRGSITTVCKARPRQKRSRVARSEAFVSRVDSFNRHPFPDVVHGCLLEGMQERIEVMETIAAWHGIYLAPLYNADGPVEDGLHCQRSG
jgi:hypothetical protein